MDSVINRLNRSAKKLVSYLIPGDRVNVLRFRTRYIQGGNPQYINQIAYDVGGNNSMVTVTSDNHQGIIIGNWTFTQDNYEYATDLNLPLVRGYIPFQDPIRKRGFILFSDGLHNVDNDPSTPNIVDFHGFTTIEDNYWPRDIKCHSIFFKTLHDTQ